jgi:hypothetical protein
MCLAWFDPGPPAGSELGWTNVVTRLALRLRLFCRSLDERLHRHVVCRLTPRFRTRDTHRPVGTDSQPGGP